MYFYLLLLMTAAASVLCSLPWILVFWLQRASTLLDTEISLVVGCHLMSVATVGWLVFAVRQNSGLDCKWE